MKFVFYFDSFTSLLAPHQGTVVVTPAHNQGNMNIEHWTSFVLNWTGGLCFFVAAISGLYVLRFYFQPTVWGINRTWWDVDHQPGEGVLDDLCRDLQKWPTSYCQDARRRKLDSGRVDAEAVIDELMEVKRLPYSLDLVLVTDNVHIFSGHWTGTSRRGWR